MLLIHLILSYFYFPILDERRKKLREAAREMAEEGKGKAKKGSSKFSIDQLLDKVYLKLY